MPPPRKGPCPQVIVTGKKKRNNMNPESLPITRRCVDKFKVKFKKPGSLADKLRSKPSRIVTDDENPISMLAHFAVNE